MRFRRLLRFKMTDNRFATVAGDVLEALLEEVDASNTQRCTLTAVKTFRDYLSVVLKTLYIDSA